jgi:integrase
MGKPIVIKRDSVTVKIYQGKAGKYGLFTVTHYEGGKRQRKVFGQLKTARGYAEELATRIAKGQREILQLTNADRESYLHATRALEARGIPLHAAIEEYIALKRRETLPPKRVRDLVGDMLAQKQKDKLSKRHIRTLRGHLTAFADSFRTNIGSITKPLVFEWLNKLPGGARNHNNVRASLVTLFRYAQDAGYLPSDRRTAPEEVKRKKDTGGEIGILSPSQMSLLLTNANPRQALFLVLGGFAGIRSEETKRLTWHDIDLARRRITVSKHKAKTRSRRAVPIAPNLEQWLAQLRHAALPISQRLINSVTDMAKRLGVGWPDNCLRHSYGSYRLELTQDLARVSLEMGNSPQKIITNYRELVAEQDANRWFAIAPEGSANVLQFAVSN